MKVIKKGNTTGKTTCSECTCYFQYCKKELVFFESKKPLVICPECGNICEITVKETKD